MNQEYLLGMPSSNHSRMSSGPIALDSLTKSCPVSGLRTHWRRSESRLNEEKVRPTTTHPKLLNLS